jgi:hypothetical protein
MQDRALRDSLERVTALSRSWAEDDTLPAPFRHMSEHVFNLANDAKRHRELSLPAVKTVRLRFCSLCHRIVTVQERCGTPSLPNCPVLGEVCLGDESSAPQFLSCGTHDA